MNELTIKDIGGRPTLRTEAMSAKICEGLAYGLSNEEVAAYAGICRDTLQDWLRHDEFAERVRGAMAARKVARLKRIESGDNGWMGCAWLLERSQPYLYARPEIQIQLNGASNSEQIAMGPSDASLLKDLALVRKTVQQQRNNHGE